MRKLFPLSPPHSQHPQDLCLDHLLFSSTSFPSLGFECLVLFKMKIVKIKMALKGPKFNRKLWVLFFFFFLGDTVDGISKEVR
jgi:hypothetical protein